MSASAETIALLTSIDTTLKHLLGLAESRKNPKVEESPQIDPPVNLDSERGDFAVKAKDPRDWTGPPMTGRKLSECPATYLDLLAERYDFFNQKETDPQKRKYNTLDAARARGWAARIRAGYKSTEAPAAEGFPSDMVKSDDIEF